MARALTDFVNLHAGETAWIFGKGPSLDRFDFAEAGPLLVAINDVVGRVPGCVYGFANDSVAAWADVYRPGQVLFQPLRLEHDIHAARCPVACERVLFADDWDDALLALPPADAARCLAVRSGTLGSAHQILRLMGVARIVCVGIDGGGRHASGEWRTRLRHDHAQDYNRIRDDFIRAAAKHGPAVEFFGEPHPTHHGMKSIRIIEPCLCRGQHLAEGTVVDLPPLDAEALVSEGRAVWSATAPAAVEAAAANERALAEAGPETAEARPAIATPEKGGARQSKIRNPKSKIS